VPKRRLVGGFLETSELFVEILFAADRAVRCAEVPIRENTIALAWDMKREVPRLRSGATALVRGDGLGRGGPRCIAAFDVAR
jgi:hypothetical protein